MSYENKNYQDSRVDRIEKLEETIDKLKSIIFDLQSVVRVYINEGDYHIVKKYNDAIKKSESLGLFFNIDDSIEDKRKK